MPLVIKKAVNKVSGNEFEGEALTPNLVQYLERNREQFYLFYQGDTLVPAENPAEPPTVDKAIYSPSALQAKNKAELVSILFDKAIDAEEHQPKSDLIDMILEAQEKGL